MIRRLSATALPAAAYAAEQGAGHEESFPEIVMHHIANGPVEYGFLAPFAPFLEHWGISKAVLMMFAASFLLIVLAGVFLRGQRAAGAAPSGTANALEALVVFVRDEIAIANMGKKWGCRFTPFLLTLFFFILTCNLLGLVPGGFTATSNLNVTGALAVVSFFTFLVSGMIALGPIGYIKHMAPPGTPLAIAPLVVILEVISLFVRPITLMIRLGANMTAGHIVILIILGFIFLFQNLAVAVVSIPLAVAITILELIVAFIQAYVFTLLTALYVGMVVHSGH